MARRWGALPSQILEEPMDLTFRLFAILEAAGDMGGDGEDGAMDSHGFENAAKDLGLDGLSETMSEASAEPING